MIRSFFRSTVLLALVSLPAVAMAQAYVEEIDLLDVAEVDVLFKCEESTTAADEAVYRLAHRLSRHRRRVFSALTSDVESHFGFVRAPYQVSAPAFFERDGRILACVTVQSLGSLLPDEAEEEPAPPTEPTQPLDPNVEAVLDPNPADDDNVLIDAPVDPNADVGGPGAGLDGGYDEDDDVHLPKYGLDGRPLGSPAKDLPDVILDANNVVDRDLFGDDSAATPADQDAGAPKAADPDAPELLTDLPPVGSAAGADADTDKLPAPDASHGPIFIDGQPAPDVDDQVAPGWEALQN